MTRTRCVHDAAELFDRPSNDDVVGAVGYMLLGSKTWMVCRKCGATGYWGGYGHKRKIRWGYGSPDLVEKAKNFNAWLVRKNKQTEAKT